MRGFAHLVLLFFLAFGLIVALAVFGSVTNLVPKAYQDNPNKPGLFPSPSSLIPFKPQVTIIDAGVTAPKEGIIQDNYPPEETLAKNVLGEDYISKKQIEEEFGEAIDWTYNGDIARLMTDLKDRAPQILAHWFESYFGIHGGAVAEEMDNIWKQAGLQSQGVKITPIQSIFDQSSLKIHQTQGEVEGATLYFDSEKIIELLKNDSNRVINLSFHVGSIDFIIPNSKRPKIIGAYDKTKAIENLPKLFQVVNTYPDKLFVVALGNYGEDIRDAKDHFADKWPNNLLFIGQYFDHFLLVKGADLYVSAQRLNGSSFSTAVISGYAELFFREGLSLGEVKQKLLQSSSEFEYVDEVDDNTLKKALIFEPTLGK